ncbi:acyltransferase domain-containing protein [Streptomyces sp. H39-C1]|uniref:acyltransferase domain-containing protein n=1 Tax=Streptomyces sp. H39-C1 TaxID=3004355 RepID=UPI0022AE9D58|nr:acyltransferase domain-containing protein [Streptomyces sp. H39-C1]MCZ4097988.1 acyltransferase domain-containing protein [Streptomyces sp. H39-C1]
MHATRTVPCPLGAQSPDALGALARELVAKLTADPGVSPAQAARGLAGSPAGPHRAVVLAEDQAGLLDGLSALAAGRPADHLVTGQAVTDAGTAFVFPGQGSQWPGMATELYAKSEVFHDRLDAVAAELGRWNDWNLLDAMAGAEGAPGFERVDVVQPALFAMMVSLAAQWESYGVVPTAVIGHSQGEIAAAHVAGILSLQDAVRIVVMRGRVLRKLTGRGGMLSVPMPYEWVERYVAEHSARLALAAENGPGNLVVSGDVPALEELVQRCAEEGVRARMVKVDYPSHSPQIDEIRDELLAGIAGVAPGPGRIPYYSSVAAGRIDGTELDADYWFRNLRRTVRFESAVRAAADDGHLRFVESSPHPVLVRGVQRTLRDVPDGRVIESVRRGEGGPDRFLRSAAEAYTHGADVAWPGALFS